MSETSVAYDLAAHIHASFFGEENTELLTSDEIMSAGVESVVGSSSSTTSERIEVQGTLNGRPVNQTLAKDKFGNFHLSTTYREYGGTHVQADFRPTTHFEAVELLTDTIFMHKLVAIAHMRSKAEETK